MDKNEIDKLKIEAFDLLQKITNAERTRDMLIKEYEKLLKKISGK